ncbi:unnamed protein product [Echinostoma caproni]|uniref:Cadherin domain-containing protein n=1 Tax=Echinostoma caproni TaxID=27848 RepID=A0A183BB42_9TREM|nr:unnamed protein product [Echinostoma caproni]
MKAAKKLQINANVSRNEKFSALSKVADVVLPIVYINESVTVDADTARMIRNAIYVLPLALYVVSAAILVLALFGLAVFSVLFVYHRRQLLNSDVPGQNANETTPLLQSNEQSNTTMQI